MSSSSGYTEKYRAGRLYTPPLIFFPALPLKNDLKNTSHMCADAVSAIPVRKWK
jgi:hypothetical protein